MGLGYWEWTLVLMVPAILYAAWIDYAQHRVPNWLTASIAASGLVMQGAFFGLQGLSVGGLGLLLGFGVLIIPWLMHGMGAGDVKLMAAIGAWLGPWLTLWSFAVGALLGGLAAVVMIAGSGRTAHALANMQTIMVKMRRADTAFGEYGSARSFGKTSQLLPYGVPLTVGTIGVLVTYYAGGWLS
ncbi:MAG: A24 family peptidase [Phycisphaerae bacterium]